MSVGTLKTPAPVDPIIGITADSQLIEGFLQTTNIQVDPPGLSPRPLSVFMNASGNSEALTIQGGNLFHVCREPLSDSGWNVYAIGAGFTRISGQNSATVWATNEGTGGSEAWQSYLGRWAPVTTQADGQPITDVAVGTDGIVRGIAAGLPYEWNAPTGQWTPMANPPGPNQTFTRAPVGSPAAMLAISGQTFYFMGAYTGHTWFPFVLPDQPDVTDVSVGSDNSNWFIANGNLYQCDNPADLNPVQVSLPPGQSAFSVFAISATELWCTTLQGPAQYQLYQATRPAAGQPFTWTLVATPGDSAALQLSVGTDGTMWLLDSSGQVWNQLGGVWQRLMVPTNMVSNWQAGASGMTEVATVTDADGDLFAYFIWNGKCFWMTFEDGMWSPQPNAFTASNGQTIASGLRTTNDLVTNGAIVYGVSTDGNLIVGGDATSLVTPLWCQSNVSLANAPLQLRGGGSGTWYVYTVVDSKIQFAWGPANNPVQSGFIPLVRPDGLPQPDTFVSLIDVPCWQMANAVNFAATMVLAIDTTGTVSVVVNPDLDGNNAIFEPISGLNIPGFSLMNPVVASAGYMTGAPTGMLCVIAIDTTNVLWLLRSIQQQDGSWAMSAWHPLTTDCIYVALGPTGTAGDEIFTLDQNASLNRLWNDPTSLAWSELPIHQPTFVGGTIEPYYITQYVTEITVSDTSQLPSGRQLANYSVALVAAENVTVAISGVTYDLGPTLPSVTVTTDYRGKVTVSTPALGLHTPQLTFTAGPATCVVYPPQIAQTTLSTVNQSQLDSAQSKTAWNASENLVTDGAPETNVSATAQALNYTIQIKTNKQITGGTIVSPGLDRTLALRPGRLPGRVAMVIGPNGQPADVGGFWGDIVNAIEDLFQAIREGIITIANVVVDVENAVIQFEATLAGLGSQLISIVIQTIHDVVGALETAFLWVVSAIEKVIDWLKEIFDWANILHVKDVLEAYVQLFISNTIASMSGENLTALQAYVTSGFQALATRIAGFFDQIGSISGQPVSSQPAMQTSSPVGSTALTQDKSSQNYAANQVKSNYVHTQTNTYIQQGGTLGAGGGATLAMVGDPISDLTTAITTLLGQIGTQVYDDFQTNLQAMQPSGLFGNTFAVIVDVFATIAEAVVQAVGDLINLVLGMAADALPALATTLTTPLNIPVLSWLYQALTRHPLTILDLVCLVFAFPATIVFVTLGGDPQQFQLPGSQSWPSIQNLPPVGAALMRGPRHVPRRTARVDDIWGDVLGPLYALTYLAYAGIDAWGDTITAANVKAGKDDPFTGFVSLLDVSASIIGQSLGGPWELFSGEESWTVAEALEVATWGANFAPIVTNTVYLTSSGSTAKFAGNLGVVVTSLLGLSGVGLASGALVYTAAESPSSTSDILSAVGDFVQYLPVLGKLLLLEPILDDSEGGSLIVLVVLDLVCDIANGALTCAALVTSS